MREREPVLPPAPVTRTVRGSVVAAAETMTDTLLRFPLNFESETSERNWRDDEEDGIEERGSETNDEATALDLEGSSEWKNVVVVVIAILTGVW